MHRSEQKLDKDATRFLSARLEEERGKSRKKERGGERGGRREGGKIRQREWGWKHWKWLPIGLSDFPRKNSFQTPKIEFQNSLLCDVVIRYFKLNYTCSYDDWCNDNSLAKYWDFHAMRKMGRCVVTGCCVIYIYMTYEHCEHDTFSSIVCLHLLSHFQCAFLCVQHKHCTHVLEHTYKSDALQTVLVLSEKCNQQSAGVIPYRKIPFPSL